MKDKEKQQNPSDFSGTLSGVDELLRGVEGADLSLEEILAEFSSQPEAPPRREKPRRPAVRDIGAAPPRGKKPPPARTPEGSPRRADRPAPQVVVFPVTPPPEEEKDRTPPPRPPSRAVPQENKVIPLYDEEPENPIRAGLESLFRRADEYADAMYAEEDNPDPNIQLAEKYIPGTDVEVSRPRREPRDRPPRPQRPPPPDTPPAELARRYAKGLGGLRLRSILVFLLALPLLYLNAAESFHLPLPPLAPEQALYLPAALWGGLALAALLGIDVILSGLADPFLLRPGLNTLTALAVLATLGDGGWYLFQGREGPLPLCGVSALSLFCAMWGAFLTRRGLRLTCRTAAAAANPYVVTNDAAKWNARGTFTKHPGDAAGFGSQVQQPDGAQRIYRFLVPVLLLACLLFALMSSGEERTPGRLLWCLSVILTAAAPLSGLLAFGLPFSRLARRLAQSGSALAGWTGVEAMAGDAGILITDADLFPPGAVKLNGIKIFGDWPVEKVVAVTASLIRDSGCGLDKIFHDLLRTQGAIYRHTKDFTSYESGGLSAVIRNEQILVGSAPFMALMEVSLPQGLNVKNAVFCAIDGELAGIFALNYTQPATVYPALTALIRSKVAPVLATRDFNVIPVMLRQRFKLPVERMEFPPIERRVELSAEPQPHSPVPAAILCREGLGPFSDAVVGGRRLRKTVRANAILACVSSAAGALLSFYLTYISAYTSLTPGNILVFLVMWLIPTLLLSWNINSY